MVIISIVLNSLYFYINEQIFRGITFVLVTYDYQSNHNNYINDYMYYNFQVINIIEEYYILQN